MSTNELSELIAMGCPDLGSTTTNGSGSNSGSASGSSTQIHIYDEKRRLSVKQMTATELLAARAAAAMEIKQALIKVNEPSQQAASAPATPLAKFSSSNSLSFPPVAPATVVAASAPTSPLSENKADKPKTPLIVMELADSDTNESRSHSPGEAHLDAKVKLLPSSPAPRDRITSLPSILDDGMEEHLLSLSKSGKPTETSNPELNSSANSLRLQRSDDSNSPNSGSNLQPSSSNTSLHDMGGKGNCIMDSIELMRKQRCNRDNSRERRSDSLLDERRFNHERSNAPDRLHSSSISSIGSAVGGANSSLSLSLNPSKNTSRRNSNSSNISEVSTSATVVLPPTPPIFPLTKTNSAPNMERRRSSLSALFPGPSPLVAPEPILHTDPKVDEEYTKEEIAEIVQDTLEREIPTGKMIHRTKTPPPVGVSLGVNLKKVTPPRSHITVKKNEGPMLGVVLRKVEKKAPPQKSILDDDKPLYHLSIVRSDGKDHKPSDHHHHHTASKPKPKPAPLQKSATVAVKPNPGGILTGPQTATKIVQPAVPAKPQRPAPGVPITIQKIEGDKIIIIKKYIVPKNTKLPEHLIKVG
ncbi:hypothetical protein DOY81_003934, partial [Sarcophaga bullata]